MVEGEPNYSLTLGQIRAIVQHIIDRSNYDRQTRSITAVIGQILKLSRDWAKDKLKYLENSSGYVEINALTIAKAYIINRLLSEEVHGMKELLNVYGEDLNNPESWGEVFPDFFKELATIHHIHLNENGDIANFYSSGNFDEKEQ
jgi:hypothetical protein